MKMPVESVRRSRSRKATARRPDTAAASMPASRTTGSPTRPPAASSEGAFHRPAPAMTGGAMRDEKRAAAGGCRAGERPGGDGDPRAADAREGRQALRRADGQRVAEAQLEQPTVPAAMTLGKPEDGRAPDQEQADERWPPQETRVQEG